MRPSTILKRRVRWVHYSDERPGLHPTREYEMWARVFDFECRCGRLLRWRFVAPARRFCGLPHTVYGPGGWR